MKTYALTLAALAAVSVAGQAAHAAVASYYRTITVDGDVSDWAGIQPAYTDATGDGFNNPNSNGTVDYTNIYVANDANFLYYRIQLDQPATPNIYASNFFINGDGDGTTGYGLIGAEAVIQAQNTYQVASGAFTDGALDPASTQLAVSDYNVVGTDGFEFAISRATLLKYGAYANKPLFTSNNITLEAETDKPNNAGPGDEAYPIAYTFAAAPEPATLGAIAAFGGIATLRRRRRRG